MPHQPIKLEIILTLEDGRQLRLAHDGLVIANSISARVGDLFEMEIAATLLGGRGGEMEMSVYPADTLLRRGPAILPPTRRYILRVDAELPESGIMMVAPVGLPTPQEDV